MVVGGGGGRCGGGLVVIGSGRREIFQGASLGSRVYPLFHGEAYHYHAIQSKLSHFVRDRHITRHAHHRLPHDFPLSRITTSLAAILTCCIYRIHFLCFFTKKSISALRACAWVRRIWVGLPVSQSSSSEPPIYGPFIVPDLTEGIEEKDAQISGHGFRSCLLGAAGLKQGGNCSLGLGFVCLFTTPEVGRY